MEKVQDRFAQLIGQRLDELGISSAAVERQAGLGSDALRNILRGANKKGPSLENAHAMCTALGLEFSLGSTGAQATQFGFAEDANAGIATEYFTVALHEEAGERGRVDGLAMTKAWADKMGVAPLSVKALLVGPQQEGGAFKVGDAVLIDTLAPFDLDGGVFAYFDSAMGSVKIGSLLRISDARIVASRGQVGQLVVIPPDSRLRVIGRYLATWRTSLNR